MPKAKKTKHPTIELNGKSINLNSALPLTLGDWRKLEELGVSASELSENKMADTIKLLLYVSNKANSDVTVEDIESVTLDHELVQSILDSLRGEDTDVDPPSST